MDGLALARVVHVIGVVLWIGGVAMVTTVLLPAMRKMEPGENPVALFERLEGAFARQAKVVTVLTGLSGLYMLEKMDALGRYQTLDYWWLHAMTLVWALFTVVLFLLEPLVLHRWFTENGERRPAATLRVAQGFHVVLLALSLVAIAGAVSGSHGWFWF